MGKSRSRGLSSNKLLESTDSCVYIVDQDMNVRYVNPACCKWLELEKQQLVGAQCRYTSNNLKDEVENRIRGLTPPPETFQGESSSGHVFVDHSPKTQWRSAFFSPWQLADEPKPWVMVVTGHQNCEPAPVPNAPGFYHEMLAKIRLNDQKVFSLDNLVGTSPYSIRMRRQVQAAGNSDGDVLIYGPAGSGREHLARTIFHMRSSDETSLVTIHCQIADGEMIQRRIREWVMDQKESGAQDWILLLEVDRLPESAQQELWGFATLPDFQLRTIATANRPLIELVKDGQFHPSLGFFLSTFTIETSALTNRIEDLELLTQAFLESNNAKNQNQLSVFSRQSIELMAEYNWPRNLDQLKSAVDYACRSATGTQIQSSDLPEEIRHGVQARRIGRHQVDKINLTAYLEEIEKKLIQRAIRQAKFNKTRAAELLGVNRARLLRRLSHFEIGDSATENPNETELIDPSAFEETDE